MSNDTDQETMARMNDAFGKEVTVDVQPHGRNDQLRISICSYRGARFVNLRVWFRGTDHKFRPTKTGVTFQPRQLDSIIKALEETKRRLEQSAQDREHAPSKPATTTTEG